MIERFQSTALRSRVGDSGRLARFLAYAKKEIVSIEYAEKEIVSVDRVPGAEEKMIAPGKRP